MWEFSKTKGFFCFSFNKRSPEENWVFLHMLLLENEAQIDKNNYGTTLFVLKQVSLPKISLILQKHLSHAWHPSSEEILKNQSLFILSKNKRRNPLYRSLNKWSQDYTPASTELQICDVIITCLLLTIFIGQGWAKYCDLTAKTRSIISAAGK